MTDDRIAETHIRRRNVRRRAMANLMLILLAEAQRSGGRFRVLPHSRETMLLVYGDVRTLVRQDGVFSLAPRDFVVILACPDLWPFDRTAALAPFVIAPDDFAHPNSDGRHLCVDLQGVLPDRLPELLYDNLRVRRFRLDHCLDLDAAAFVRANLSAFPADNRPLYVGGRP